MFEEDYYEDEDGPMQTFLFPIGSKIKHKYENTECIVAGYVTYGGDIFHVLLDEYMQEFDNYISPDSAWEIVGEA